MKKTAVAVAVAASALGMSQFAAADFVKDSKLSLDLRNYYFAQDVDAHDADDNGVIDTTEKAKEVEGGQWGQAFMLNYQSGFTEGTVGFGIDLFGAAAYKLADHGDQQSGMLFAQTRNSAGQLEHSADRLNKAGATLKARAGNTTAYAGALRPNTPVFVANDARLLPEMVEGVLVTNQDIAGLTLAAGHVTKVSSRDNDSWTRLTKSVHEGEFSLFGADYKVMDGLTAQYYFSNLENQYQQHFAGLKYASAIGGGKLGADLRWFSTKDETEKNPLTGEQVNGGKTNNLWSALVNYSVAGHTIGLGYQQSSEKGAFRAVSNSKYLITERMLGAMHERDESVTLVSYGFDFGTVGVKGLNASVIHQMSEGAKDAGGNKLGDRTETDVIVGYTLQEGQFKGLGARLMHGMYSSDWDNDKNQTRFIVNYSIPLM